MGVRRICYSDSIVKNNVISYNNFKAYQPLKRQPHKMDKRTRATSWKQPMTISRGLALKGLQVLFNGTEYKSNLKLKLRALTWRKEINTKLCIYDLKMYTNELCGITNLNTVNAARDCLQTSLLILREH